MPVVSQAECEFNYRLYFPNQVFDNRVLCAGYAQGEKIEINDLLFDVRIYVERWKRQLSGEFGVSSF